MGVLFYIFDFAFSWGFEYITYVCAVLKKVTFDVCNAGGGSRVKTWPSVVDVGVAVCRCLLLRVVVGGRLLVVRMDVSACWFLLPAFARLWSRRFERSRGQVCFTPRPAPVGSLTVGFVLHFGWNAAFSAERELAEAGRQMLIHRRGSRSYVLSFFSFCFSPFIFLVYFEVCIYFSYCFVSRTSCRVEIRA